MKIKSLLFALCFASTAVYAGNGPQIDRLLGDLSRCDATFFETLGQRVVQYSSNPSFQMNGPYGSFRVLNRLDPENDVRTLTPPLRLNDLEAVAYFDQLFYYQDAAFFFWGFKLRASMDQVVAATRPLIWESTRLRAEKNSFVRSEILDQNNKENPWQKLTTINGQAPKPGSVERVLFIEPDEDNPDLIRFGCTIQGALTAELLRSERPDLQLKKK